MCFNNPLQLQLNNSKSYSQNKVGILTVRTGPIVKSSSFLLAARSLNWRINEVLFQFYIGMTNKKGNESGFLERHSHEEKENKNEKITSNLVRKVKQLTSCINSID